MQEDHKKTIEAAMRAGGCPECPSCAGIGRRLTRKQLDGALTLLGQRGVTVLDVAHRDHVAPGTIYNARTRRDLFKHGITAKVFATPMAMLAEDDKDAEELAQLLWWWERPQVEEEADA